MRSNTWSPDQPCKTIENPANGEPSTHDAHRPPAFPAPDRRVAIKVAVGLNVELAVFLTIPIVDS